MIEHAFEDHNGRTIYARDFEFSPCQVDQLLDFIDKKPIEICLSNAIIRAEGFDASERYSISGKLTPALESSTFALVRGGWAPASIALDNAFALVDKNFVSEIGYKFKNGDLKKGEVKDFIDFSNKISFEANIIAYGIEGNKREKPSVEVIRQQLDEARKIINQSLPNVTVFPPERFAVRTAVEVSEKSWEGSAKRQEFFKRIAPMLMENIGIDRRRLVWNNICSVARDCGLEKDDLSVILSLSTTCSKGKLNYAKKIIKPSREYSDEDAFNAAFDITLISLFISGIVNIPNKKHVLVTRDKNLALFWTGVYCDSFIKVGNSIRVNAGFYGKLFPDIEGWEDIIKELITK